jgi:hypothetical protein
MPLRADRAGFEWSLRALATVALAWLVIGAFLVRTTSSGQRIDSADVPDALQAWTTSPPADTMGLRLSGGLDRRTLDYLRALRANGSAVAWTNEGVLPVMLEAEPLQDPAGGVVARITGTEGTVLSLSDSLGVLDSLRIDRLGITVRIPAYSGGIAVSTGSTVASVAPRAPGPARSIVVLGMAGWESKFTGRALEERGWTVESRIGIAPGLSTLRGKPFPLDTARHATVIALDSSAASYTREIQQFVRSGGGLVVGPGAAPYFARSPSAEVTTVAQRDRGVTLAAWRTGSGRVIRTDQPESWRWRMALGETSVADHREWWAGLVGAVAYRSGAVAELANPAPLASLVQELGSPGPLPGNTVPTTLWPVLLVVFLVSLFAEWLSRRLRGEA